MASTTTPSQAAAGAASKASPPAATASWERATAPGQPSWPREPAAPASPPPPGAGGVGIYAGAPCRHRQRRQRHLQWRRQRRDLQHGRLFQRPGDWPEQQRAGPLEPQRQQIPATSSPPPTQAAGQACRAAPRPASASSAPRGSSAGVAGYSPNNAGLAGCSTAASASTPPRPAIPRFSRPPPAARA